MKTIPIRTFDFGVSIVRFVSVLPKNAAGYAVASQIVRSGTSVGANVEEAQDASSRKEFVRGLSIALKEARETLYWLKVVKEAGLVKSTELESLISEAGELIRILISSVKNSRESV